MNKVHEHATPDAKPAAPIYRHASETARSKGDAGGEVKNLAKVPGRNTEKA